MAAFLSGFALSLSLILAIGAQNAFVLRQGLRGEHVFAVCLLCALSDAVLIAAGVAGMGAAVTAWPALAIATRWGGAAFLAVYGALSFRRAMTGDEALAPSDAAPRSLAATLAVCAALTWGNPHVYLDTMVLLGSVSAARGAGAVAFGVGAACASAVFFFALGYGARALRPLFARPRAWVLLEALIGVTMWVIAAGLALG